MNKIIDYKFYILASIACVFVLVGCDSKTESNSSESVSVSDQQAIGWLHGNCLAVKSLMDMEGKSLLVVDLDNHQVVTNYKVGEEATSSDDCYALLEDRVSINNQQGRKFYKVLSKKAITLGIGLITDKPLTSDEVLDINGDGQKDSFVYCATAEGMQFSIWDGEAYKSKKVWSDYYYLGYDSESNCPD